MRTTITVDDDSMMALMKSEKTKNPAEAIRRVIQQHLRRRKMEKFMGGAGRNLLRDDYTNESLEAGQIRDARKYER